MTEEKIMEIATKIGQHERSREAARQYMLAYDTLRSLGVPFDLLDALDVAAAQRLCVTEELAYVFGKSEV